MSATIWATEGAYTEILTFRFDPSSYLNSRRLDEESLVHDILQSLCQETVPAKIKIHILNLLHEYAAAIITTITSAEEVVASLLDILSQTSKDGPSIFRGQILVASTSVALQYDFRETRPELFAKLVEILLDLICHTGKAEDSHLRTIACSCLQELEILIPCMLQNKLEYVYQLAQMEKGAAAQGYFLLLSTILRHALGSLRLQAPDQLSSNALRTLLTNRTEPLKPYIMPKLTFDCHMTRQVADSRPLVGMDLSELRRLVAFVMDNATLMTSSAQICLLYNMIHVVKGTPDITPSVFKWVIMRNARSTDAGFINLLLALQGTFGEALLDGSDTAVLFRSIVTSFAHPGLHASHRRMLLQWLSELTEVGACPGWPALLGEQLLVRSFPRTFDGCQLQLKKLELLSHLLPSYLPDDEVEDILCSFLQSVQTSVESGLGGRYATVLFRALYIFYQHLPDPTLVSSIQWILVRLGQKHSRLALRVLNFVEATQNLYPESDLGREVLLSLLMSITEVNPTNCSLTQIQHHLVVLHRIASESGIKPKVIVSYLQELVALEAVCALGDWETGSRILSVCRNLMAHYNVPNVFVGLADVLHILSISHCDVDIRDRAAFYYTLLASLAPHKLTSLLSLTTTAARDTQGLACMVSRNSDLCGPRPVARLSPPLLKLTRIGDRIITIEEKRITGNDKEILDEYSSYLQENDELRKVSVDVYLHFEAEADEEISDLFAIELHFEASQFYKAFSDIRVPCLRRKESSCPGPQCCRLTITLEPITPVPIHLSPEAVFTSTDSQTWRSLVAGVDISLADLWRPLPVHETDRVALFRAMWQDFSEKDSVSTNGPLLSVLCLGLKKDTFRELVASSWRPLEVKVDSILSTLPISQSQTRVIADASPPKDQDQDEICHMALFLAPKYHVLMEATPSHERTVIYLATDHAEVLPLLSDYLRTLEQ